MPGIKGRSGGKRVGAGRTAFCPTDAQRKKVALLAGFGLRQEDIVGFIHHQNNRPISCDTLTKYFREELSSGRIKANVAIIQTLYQKAIKGDNTCIIFWLRTQAGWHDSIHRFEHSGPNGLPISTAKVSVAQFKKAVRDVTDSY